MRKKLNLKQLLAAAVVITLGTMLGACEEDLEYALPADGNVAYVNFVNAAEVFLFGQNDALQRDNRLYINDSTTRSLYNKTSGMIFSEEAGLDIRQYPPTISGTREEGQSAQSGDVFWLPVHAGDYQFIFTSRDRTYLRTEDMTVAKQSYQVVYLVESPDSDAAYELVQVPIERKDRVAGKVTVQFVNLSPDAGPVEAYRVDASGNEISTVTTSPLAFTQYSTSELTLEGTETTYNSILIRFRRPGGEDVQAVSVPASNGAVYTVLLRGFSQETVRWVKTSNEASVRVTVLPDLRCSVRRVFY